MKVPLSPQNSLSYYETITGFDLGSGTTKT